MSNPYIASMGVYVFRTDVLTELLNRKYPSSNDFGSEIIPSAVGEYNVQVNRGFCFQQCCIFYSSSNSLIPIQCADSCSC